MNFIAILKGVQIWVEFIMFMLGKGKLEATRQVCEDALMAVGIHLAEGILVWQTVLLVEQQVRFFNLRQFFVFEY